MRIESKLCHLTDNKAIVHVSAWLDEINLGSALAEGPTVEVAEDKAISRINKRINALTNNDSISKSINSDNEKNNLKIELPISEKIDNIKCNKEPKDWSNELTAVDLQIERLKWSRDDEKIFLEKTFGYNNRNKITSYSEIVKYLNILKNIEIQNQPRVEKENISKLINESDSILRDLSWDHRQGRDFLEKEYNVSTRKELNEEQLISFVEKLKTIRNQYQTN